MSDDSADDAVPGDGPPSTTTGGKPAVPVDSDRDRVYADDPLNRPPAEPTDLARAALAGAQRISRTQAQPKPRRRRARPTGPEGSDGSGYSGPGPDPKDPQPVGRLFAGYVEDRGWERPLAEGRLFADWASLVGPDVASHCRPEALKAGELRLTAESTAWATQLRLLSSSILARLVDELGPDVVTRLHITGPVGPSWKHGNFSVRGARGPRDTYG